MTGYRNAALWAGITFSIGNLCGAVIGARYGWPKTILHWKGTQESILDLCATVPIHFVSADGIVAMEGNGPLNGTPRPLGTIVLADDPVAADATCARLMGLEPGRIVHIREGSRFLGNGAPALIDQVGELANVPVMLSRWFPSFSIFTPGDERRSQNCSHRCVQYCIDNQQIDGSHSTYNKID